MVQYEVQYRRYPGTSVPGYSYYNRGDLKRDSNPLHSPFNQTSLNNITNWQQGNIRGRGSILFFVTDKMNSFGGNPFAPPGESAGSGERTGGDFVSLERGRETCLSARIIEHRSFDAPSGSLTGSSHIKFNIVSEIAKPKVSRKASQMRCEFACATKEVASNVRSLLYPKLVPHTVPLIRFPFGQPDGVSR